MLIALFISFGLKNSALKESYQSFLHMPIIIKIGSLGIDKSLLLWINDGLMAIFFFTISLEIKTEVVKGALASAKARILPIFSALGGIMMPTLYYISMNYHQPDNLNGWAIPVATDIAFSLGVVLFLGKLVSKNARVMLLAIAIIDDIAVVGIIALFYAKAWNYIFIGASLFLVLIMALLNKKEYCHQQHYIILAFLLWMALVPSGIHPTLAGVALGLTVPIEESERWHHFEKKCHDIVAFMIVPLFVLANGGIDMRAMSLSDLSQPITIGVICGLWFGKSTGIFLFAFIAEKIGWAKRPEKLSWPEFYGVACLAGIGFTMSLFIVTLAFEHSIQREHGRLGILIGSFLSALSGISVFKTISLKK
jgi:NhaA family Na+:H+ antiporter